ncbi:hypothetical protein BuS5_01327 [Desulfosarcina sp. BuS5]|uniref:radical SAM protein n=1 Tax=Desulfosarcina sp. BuS5 TaxID=933262 RepID=UPI000482B237|nr:radical SAM protein [Desulfosarcina sp. BuS5]WDN88359.1 hypothetical protein BuS5_01327 [Desulfosarcina sp. BuS5]
METDIEINSKYPILSRLEFSAGIRKKKEGLKNLFEIDNHELSVWAKPPSGKIVSKGCQACRAGRYLCFYVGKKCNVDCIYCAQGTKQEKWNQPEDPDLINDKYHLTEIMEMFNNPDAIWAGPNVRCIAYSGGEPFIYLDKVLSLSYFVSRYYSHIYQMIITNGLLVTEDKLKALYDNGVKEIKFHIGATNFSKKVLDNLEMASGIMDYVNIETPATPELKEFLIDKKRIHWLENVGVYQIGMGELGSTSILHLNKINEIGDKRVIEYFQKLGQLYVCESVIGKSTTAKDMSEVYISPIVSKEIMYDIMKYAVENKVDVVINDCSQDAKHFQRFQRNVIELTTSMAKSAAFQPPEYIQGELAKIESQKMKMLEQYNGPQAQDWLKPLIRRTTRKDENGWHIKLEELAKSIIDYLEKA